MKRVLYLKTKNGLIPIKRVFERTDRNGTKYIVLPWQGKIYLIF